MRLDLPARCCISPPLWAQKEGFEAETGGVEADLHKMVTDDFKCLAFLALAQCKLCGQDMRLGQPRRTRQETPRLRTEMNGNTHILSMSGLAMNLLSVSYFRLRLLVPPSDGTCANSFFQRQSCGSYCPASGW